MTETEEKVSSDLLEQSLLAEETEVFRHEFSALHPYEQAVFFMDQEYNNRMQIYAYLSPKEMSDIMENIDLQHTEKYITEMDSTFDSMILAEMAVDDAVDILQELTKDEVASFLTIMEQEAANEIKALLHYEEKTAGSIMTTEFVALYKNQTVQEAMRELKTVAPDAETIYYLYVLDDNKRLAGVLSLRDLIIAAEDVIIETVMSEKVVSVSVAKDQEEIAQMMRDYDFLAV